MYDDGLISGVSRGLCRPKSLDRNESKVDQFYNALGVWVPKKRIYGEHLANLIVIATE